MKTARFATVVAKAGRPEVYLALMDPAKDRVLQAALKANRVMTVSQETVGHKTDRGQIGFKDEDFARVDVEATQTVDIMNFVSIEDVDPLLFYKPYYLEAAKGGDKAYVLLRDALTETGKIAIAKVVIRTR